MTAVQVFHGHRQWMLQLDVGVGCYLLTSEVAVVFFVGRQDMHMMTQYVWVVVVARLCPQHHLSVILHHHWRIGDPVLCTQSVDRAESTARCERTR